MTRWNLTRYDLLPEQRRRWWNLGVMWTVVGLSWWRAAEMTEGEHDYMVIEQDNRASVPLEASEG